MNVILINESSGKALNKFVRGLLKLSALGHDTGKATLGYANKLKHGSGAEAVRHDLMSFLMLAESLWPQGVNTLKPISDVQWLERLAREPESLCSCVQGNRAVPEDGFWVSKVKTALNSEKGLLLARSELESLQTLAPGLMTMLWLVLTHHRLPQGDDSSQQIDASSHVNKTYEIPDSSAALKPKYKIAPVSECFTVAPGTPPWQDAAWLAAVKATAQATLDAYKELSQPDAETLPGFFWPLIAAHYLRPTLILSDHLGSKQSVKSWRKKDAAAKEHIFANTFDDKYYADTLSQHELKVARLTRDVLDLATGPMPVAQMDPRKSLALKLPELPEFMWQVDAQAKCAEAAKLGPVFLSVIAETGSGKTLASLRCAHAMSNGNLRLTFAMGQRSLTQQAAKSMAEDACIPSEQVLLAVGHPETLSLVEQATELQLSERASRLSQDQAGARSEVFGSESSLSSHETFDLIGDSQNHDWVTRLCSVEEAKDLFGPKALDMLSAPILACTADHLVGAISLLKGGDARMWLRLPLGDLVLDEIDAYSFNDLQSIAKLAFVAGLHGKNVTLLSATMSPEIRKGIYEAWHQGVLGHFALRQTPARFAAVLASNTVDAVVLDSPSASQSESAWEAYVAAVCKIYSARELAPQRKVALLELSAKTPLDAFSEITQAGVRLHARHHTIDPKTGIRVSIGFVSFSTTKYAWRMAQYLAKRDHVPGSPQIKFVSYHSKFPRDYLGVTDATLNLMTKRKGTDPLLFLETKSLRDCLDTSPEKDVIVIVCTTSLIETGRDFDVEWCILDPRDAQAAVQAAGRVRRHRRNSPVDTPNVLILSQPLKCLEDGPDSLWSKPGIRDALPGLRVTHAVPAIFGIATSTPRRGPPPLLKKGVNRPTSPGPVTLTSEMLPVQRWEHALDAQVCLEPARNYEVNRVGFLAQAIQHLHLNSKVWPSDPVTGLPPSCSYYRNSFAPLNSFHAQETPFRGLNAATQLFMPDGSKVQVWDAELSQYFPVDHAEVSEAPAVNALIPDVVEQVSRLLGAGPYMRGCALKCKRGMGRMKSLTWDPLLGFLET
jgi:CRISPR-associated endonuclease/helicase Cas3